MPPISVLIKPASSACNMNCSYCFYKDVASNRDCFSRGILSTDTAEQIIKRAFEFASGSCSFLFQGGEPTLAGLDFFKDIIEIEKKYSHRGIKVYNALQTNGFLIDDEWAEFLAANKFLTGISLDGPADIHNANRKDNNGGGTFNRVMKACSVLKKHGAEFNILCVVTPQTVRYVEKIYNFYKKNGFNYLQFIPCLDSLENEQAATESSLTAEEYGEFLVKIYNLWERDFKKGNYISIRHIDNYINMLLGRGTESCDMCGKCSLQFVAEADGGIYPCDFYVLDEWRMGSVFEKSFSEMTETDQARNFIRQSLPVPDECKDCFCYQLCRNGCRRHRNKSGKTVYCEAYKYFFGKCSNALINIANSLAVY